MGAEEYKEAPSRQRDAEAATWRHSLARRAKFALRNAAATLLLPLAKLENLRGSYIAILSYHRVLPGFPPGSPRTASIEPRTFARQLEFLIRNDYDVLSLEGLKQVLDGEAEPPRRAVILTFDDGYADNFLTAHKIGLEYEVPLNFFLPTGIIGLPHWPFTWDHRTPQEEWHITHYPELWRPLTWDEVAQMKKSGAHFGCQGYMHRRLAKLPEKELEDEIGRGVFTFSEHLGATPLFFAIPWGDVNSYTDDALSILKRHGIRMAFTSFPWRIKLPYTEFLFPRIEIGEHDSLAAFSRKIQGAHDLLYRFFKSLGNLE